MRRGYGADYVNRLCAAAQRQLRLPAEFICFTEAGHLWPEET